MFKVGDKVKTISSKYCSNNANRVYANRNATIIKIKHCASYTTYTIKFDEPFYDYGYKVETISYDSYQDGLVLRI